jgi:UDP-glucuronate decarboxylase
LTHSESKIVFTTLPEDDPKQRQPDISYAKSELDWKPEISLEDGLRKTIVYFKKILEGL